MTLESLPKPVLFAHRGAKAHAPENTLSSFRLAVEHGADAIELDVKLTADGEVVVLHDTTLDRTTNGHGLLKDHSFAQVRALDAGSWFSADFAGEPVPTLAEVFEAVGQQLFINIELTNYTTPRDALVEKVVDLVRQYHMEESVLFSSFLSLNILKVRRWMPDVPAGLLADVGWAGFLARSPFGRRIAPAILHPYVADTTTELITAQHRLGRRVHVWTVNDPEDMRRLYRDGVDGIFTDDPRLARQILTEQDGAAAAAG